MFLDVCSMPLGHAYEQCTNMMLDIRHHFMMHIQRNCKRRAIRQRGIDLDMILIIAIVRSGFCACRDPLYLVLHWISQINFSQPVMYRSRTVQRIESDTRRSCLLSVPLMLALLQLVAPIVPILSSQTAIMPLRKTLVRRL